ncbi:MAG: FAD binding domain-containing protein, partial [Dehalococcoidia bacterium]|nr:FAD binding domain-containing protein [Dehalococcoidia bacterium]
MYRFEHVNVYSVDEATEQLARTDKKAGIIAGGTDLLTTLKGMCIPNPPDLLVNIKTIPDLNQIDVQNGVLKIGACATLTEIAESDKVAPWAVLQEAALKVASPQLRNKGTIGGNICQLPRCIYYRKHSNRFYCTRKDDAPTSDCFASKTNGVNRYHSIFGGVGGCFAVCPSDIAPALVALDAKINTNKKTWDAEDFFYTEGEQINSLEKGEFVTSIEVPALASGTKSTYLKFAFRRSFDFPLVSCAAVVTVSGGSVSDASIVLGGVHNRPRIAEDAEESIVGKSISAANAAAAGEAGV